MRKVILCLVCVLIFFQTKTINVHAESYSALLSPALEILYQSTKIKKGAPEGAGITFEKEDFDEIFGEGNYRAIKIHTLPNPACGSLWLNGTAVSAGQVIPVTEISNLSVKPNGPDEAIDSFEFSNSANDECYSCLICFQDKGEQSVNAVFTNEKIYKNTSALLTLESSGNIQSFEIVEGPKNGMLERIDSESILYRPKTNFVGTDRFRYRIVDEYGNKSEIKSKKIRVDKASDNLYFLDMIESCGHSEAILLCEEGLMQYRTNNDGLPIFEPNLAVSADEFYEIVSRISQKSDMLFHHENKSEPITRKDALTCVEELFSVEGEIGVQAGTDESLMQTLTRGECALLLGKYLNQAS